jgi:hypothetical protein
LFQVTEDHEESSEQLPTVLLSLLCHSLSLLWRQSVVRKDKIDFESWNFWIKINNATNSNTSLLFRRENREN